MADLPKTVALVYDRVNKWGGAERVLLELHSIFPTAPLYTSVYNDISAPWAKVFPSVIPSFLQSLGVARTSHEFFPWLTPLCFESQDFSNFQMVISVTSSDSKGILTKPETLHINYCLTPTRYLWSHEAAYKSQIDPYLYPIAKTVISHLKRWDLVASRRPDFTISISRTVSDRIKRYYGLDSEVVYPPAYLNLEQFVDDPDPIPEYFLFVGRLVFHKRPDVVVQAFNKLKKKIVVVGTGAQEKKLKNMSGDNIVFAGQVSDTELSDLYRSCKAVIFFHEEDFGLVPVEAHSYGKPVIGINRGGVAEVVEHGISGVISDDESVDGLVNAVKMLDSITFSPKVIIEKSKRFSKEKFAQNFVKVVSKQWTKHKSIYSF